MKHLHVNTKVLTFILFFLLLLPSCNNEEIFVIEESAIIAEETEEETEEEEPNTEDEVIPINLLDDAVTTTENNAVDLEPYINDENLPQTITISNTNPTKGVLTINDNSTPNNFLDDTLVYTPNTGFSGTDSFEYTVCDASNTENCDTATVSITIEPIEDDIATELKAFPSAYGGGAYATGGRGGNVYTVSNLNDSGTGSLRWALTQPRPAIVVFSVSGTIDIQSWLQIYGSDLTIAGQTAPVGGITITSSNNSRFRFRSCNNIIMRYIRIRPLESGNDAFEIFSNPDGSYNIILDHISISYGGDEAMSARGVDSHNITYQRCLIAESKTGSLFGDSSSPELSWDNSMLNCLFWNVSHRHPNAGSDNRVDVINNVVHNWQYRLVKTNGHIKLNHINNYHSMGGRNTLGGGQINLNALNSVKDNAIYTAGNIIDKGMFEDPNADNKALWVEFDSGRQTEYAPASEFISSPYPLIGAPLPIKTAVDAYQDVISDVGADVSLNADGTLSDSKDVNDKDYLDVMAQGEGAYEAYTMKSDIRSWFGEQRYANFVSSISSTPINSRSAGYDTDGDGMPNIWESNNGYNPNVKDDSEDRDGDGYTNLEEFLNLVDNK